MAPIPEFIAPSISASKLSPIIILSENFEAVAARRGEDGDTYVYVMADDNFSIFQSTLLLQFKLKSNFTNH